MRAVKWSQSRTCSLMIKIDQPSGIVGLEAKRHDGETDGGELGQWHHPLQLTGRIEMLD